MTNQDKANLWKINPMTGKRVLTAKEMLSSMKTGKRVQTGVIDRHISMALASQYEQAPIYQTLHSRNIWRAI